MRPLIFIALALSLVLTSCSTKLVVTVHIADKTQVARNPEVRAAINRNYAQEVIRIRESPAFRDLSQESRALIATHLDRLVASGTLDRGSRPEIQQNLEAWSQDRINTLKLALNAIVAADPDTTALNYYGWLQGYNYFRDNLAYELETVLADEGFTASANEEGVSPSPSGQASADYVSRNRITGEFGTFGDPVISHIIHSSADIWSSEKDEFKGVFNRAQARARHGSTDVAVVMEDVGQFYMKGARVDASETIQAIRKSATMTLGLLANSLALPIDLPGKASETGDAEGFNALYEAELAVRNYESARRKLRMHTLSVMDAVLLTATPIDSNSNTVAATAALQSAVVQYSDALRSINNK